MWMLVVIVWLIFLFSFAGAFYRELKRTPWDLMEAMILFVCVGHTIALPIAWAWKQYLRDPRDEWLVNAYGSGGLLYAVFMVGGAVWVFRRLNRLNERRRGARIRYLFLGMLLFPSMTILPIGSLVLLLQILPLGVGASIFTVYIWASLIRFHERTVYLPDPADALEAAAAEAERLRRRDEARKNLSEQYGPLSKNDGAAP